MFFMNVIRKHRPTVASLLLGCLLTVQAMAAFPALHALVHPDADDPAHECAVTLFCHGQVDASPSAVPILPAPELVTFTELPPQVVFVSTDVRLIPSRGPPASSVLA